MRTTVRIPEPLHRRLRVQAAERGEPFGALVVSAIERGLPAPRLAAAVAEPLGPYEEETETLRRQPDGSVRISPAHLAKAGLTGATRLQVAYRPGGLWLRAASPVADSLAGSLADMWEGDPAAPPPRLRREDSQDD